MDEGRAYDYADSPTTEKGFDTSVDGNNKRNVLHVGSNPISKLPSASARPPALTIDPLSHHILKRTNTENTINPLKLKARNAGVVSEEGGSEAKSPEIGTPTRLHTPEATRSDINLVPKEKKKGVSFLSRFSIIGNKKKDQDQNDDEESEFGDERIEGMNATVPFSASIGANGGYIPQFKEPPRYIKVHSHNKNPKTREFNRCFLAEIKGSQPIQASKNPSISESSDVRPQSPNKLLKKPPETASAIWACEFSKDGKYLAVAGQSAVITLWKVLSTAEERQAYEQEEASSNASNGERLSAPVFGHKPAKVFTGHEGPILDLDFSKNNFLLSSSMDKTCRLYHVSRDECLVVFSHKDYVTSISFHPNDDRFFLAGSLDHIMRLWSIPDKEVAFVAKLPDMITAVAFSPDGKVAIGGCFSGSCHFFETEGLKYTTQILVRSSRGKNSRGSKITGIKTATLNGDPDAVKVLITSNDSRIRLYNLRDKALEMKFKGHENTSSQLRASFSDDQGKHIICGSEDGRTYIWNTSHAAGETKDKFPLEYFQASDVPVTVAIMAPIRSRQALDNSGDELYDLCLPKKVVLLSREESNAPTPKLPPEELQVGKKELTPAYLEKSGHRDGQIMITADSSGLIKVFRQDCAHSARDQWDNALSKKILGRTNSIRTRNSNSSRRSSLSLQYAGGSTGHILNWRSNIPPKSSRERSSSPNKLPNRDSFASSQNNISQIGKPYAPTPLTTASSITTASPPHSEIEDRVMLPVPSFTFTTDKPKVDKSGKSYQFWNRPSGGTPPPKDDGLRPSLNGRESSLVSKLSSEASQDEDSESEILACRRCGGKDFKARKSSGKALLVCKKCLATVE